MTVQQTSENTRPDSQVYQRIFHDLPEKRKLELARVVAGMTQTQGKRAAQWWLEQQLDAHRSDHAFSEALDDLQAEGADHRGRTAAEAESVTPSRDQLVARAPTTLAVLSPEQQAYRSAVKKAEPLTQKQLEHVSAALTPQSCKVFGFLHLYACSHALSKGQSLKAFQISFFLPAETIHLATGVPTQTVYDALRRPKSLGLIDHRGHVTTLAGYGDRCDGTVFAVKLDALRDGAARVAYEDLKVDDYRNLGDDIAAERTVYASKHEYNNLPDLVRRWSGRDAEKERARTEQSSMVAKDEIAGNGYDLSINRYKEVAYTETAYDPPALILDELDALEREIQEGLEELRGMLAEPERDNALHLESPS